MKKRYTVYAPYGVILEFPSKRKALDFAMANRGIMMSSVRNFGKVI